MSKPLPPTLREKSRYLVVEFICGVQITKKDFGRVLWKTVLQVLGENGVSRLNLWIIDWDHGLGRGIVKVTHDSVDEMRACIALIKEINGVEVTPRVTYVSGTLRKAQSKL